MTAPNPAPPPVPRLSALNVVDHPDAGSQVGLVAKRTYRVRNGQCLVADEQVALVEVPQSNDDQSVLLHDFDILLNRRQTDVIVAGKARPVAKATSFDIQVRVGALHRQLRVIGPRRCYRAAGGQLRFTDPGPVTEVDLDWTSAYGGVDTVALMKGDDPLEAFCKNQKEQYNPRFGAYAYPRNRAGKGFLIEPTAEALEACALPNLEDPLDLLVPERLALGRYDRWPLAPLAAGLGWLAYHTFPRCAMLGMPSPYDPVSCPPGRFPEVLAGLLKPASIAPVAPLADRLDFAAAQQSAVGMRLSDLSPGAPVELVNLHPTLPAWSFTLSREVPQMILQMPGQDPFSLKPKIRTVFLQPELDRLSLVWVGEHREPIPIGPGKQAHIKYAVKWT